MKKRTLFGALVAISLTASVLGHASHGSYAAIAYSTWTGRFGVALGPTLRHAESAALRYCRAADCHVAVWGHNTCIGLAAGWDRTRYGWAYGPNAWDVRNRAVLNCNLQTAGCRLISWACTN